MINLFLVTGDSMQFFSFTHLKLVRFQKIRRAFFNLSLSVCCVLMSARDLTQWSPGFYMLTPVVGYTKSRAYELSSVMQTALVLGLPIFQKLTTLAISAK